MDPHSSCWWEHEEVSFQGGYGDRSIVTDKAVNVVAMINQTMIFSAPSAYQVEAGWSAKDGCCFIKINTGNPYEYHFISPSFTLKYKTWGPKKTLWTRNNSSSLAFPPQDDMANTGFRVLLEAVFASVIADAERVVIHSLGHDLAAEALCEKILANHKITKYHLHFLNRFKESDAEKTRIMNFCCKLLENCTHIQELLFEELKRYDDKLVEKLFVSIGHNQGLETIDLRDNRHMTTWEKCGRLSKKAVTRGPISIAPLVVALTHSSNRLSSSLRNLHLGGAQLSSDAVVDLARALPSLRLQKLSLRASGLGKTALVPLLRGLAKNMDLRELDLSHNLFCTYVLEQLCQSMKENKMLQRLVIEYCNINVEHLKCLAEMLPDIKSLRYLLMDGNKFTHTPMYYGLDGIAAELQGQFEFAWARTMNVEFETDTFECHDPWGQQSAEPHSLGAAILSNAMKANTSLFEVKIGEHGFSPWGMVCCTTPPHAEHWSQQARDKYKAAVDRNYKQYQEIRSTRMQQAVVRIATLLMDKIESTSLACKNPSI